MSAGDILPHIAKFNPIAAGEFSLKSLDEIEKDHIQSVLSCTPSLDEAAEGWISIRPPYGASVKKYQLD